MSSRPGSQEKNSGQRQSDERTSFPIEEISGSPVFRGRREINAAKPFPVEEISGSPVFRGNRQYSEERRKNNAGHQNDETEPFIVEDIPRSPIFRGRRGHSEDDSATPNGVQGPITKERGHNFEEEPVFSMDVATSSTKGEGSRPPSMTKSSDVVDAVGNIPGSDVSRINGNSSNSTMTTMSSTSVLGNCSSAPPDNGDAPPSYESSIPPNPIGWVRNVLDPTVPFPVPYPVNNDGSRIFQYPSLTQYPQIGLSPLAASYSSMDSQKSTGGSSTDHRIPGPSANRPLSGPVGTHQKRPIRVVRTPARPKYRANHENDINQHVKPHEQFSYKYGGVMVAIFFVAFMMLLSLTVKFLTRKSLSH